MGGGDGNVLSIFFMFIFNFALQGDELPNSLFTAAEITCRVTDSKDRAIEHVILVTKQSLKIDVTCQKIDKVEKTIIYRIIDLKTNNIVGYMHLAPLSGYFTH